jgi:CHAD domain-containing protein
VVTRRLRAALAIFRDVVRIPKAGRRGRLRWAARQLGRVRDLDVRAALIREQYLPHLAGAEAARAVALLQRLREARAKAYRRLAKGLRRRRYRRLRSALGAWGRKPAVAGGEDAGAARFMSEAADRAARVVSGHEAMRSARPSAAALHDLRIAVKWLRYTLDFHGETCGLAYDAERALARDLQNCLGEMRDHDLLLRDLAKARGTAGGEADGGDGGDCGDGADGGGSADDGVPAEAGGAAWPQLTALAREGRQRLWRRFLDLRRRWQARTAPAAPVAPLVEPRFVKLDVTPVQLRLVAG